MRSSRTRTRALAAPVRREASTASRGRRAVALALAALVPLSSLATTVPAEARKKKASAVPTVRHELPFVCGTAWTGTTRKSHSPSKHAVDFNAPGDEGMPVVATARGVVTKADNSSTKGYGRYVVLDHGNGESTVYAHLKQVHVQVGITVDRGALLGDLGNTGNSSGAHLHYEQKIGKKVVAPWIGGKAFAYSKKVTSANCVDTPFAGDLVEGGGAEVGVFRRTSTGQLLVRRGDGSTATMVAGSGIDEPVVGDWDGDGLMDPGTWSPRTKVFTLAGEAGHFTLKQGVRGDRPVAGDWDGDGRWEVGVRRGSKFRLRSAAGLVTVVALGNKRDIAVTGDWNGDGVTDLGVYDPTTSVFTLRTVTSGKVVISTVAHGSVGDLPAVGDWNADGITDLGTWSPGLATFSQRELVGGKLARAARITYGKKRR